MKMSRGGGDDDLRSKVAATRLHLADKAAEAEAKTRSSLAAAEQALLPAARAGIAGAATVGRTGAAAWETAKKFPLLVGGTLAALGLGRYAGWKGRAVLAASVAASWMAAAPQTVSDVTKSVLRGANKIARRLT